MPAERHGIALGAWGAVGGVAVAVGPLVGDAIVAGTAWNWICWVNVPIDIALVAAGDPEVARRIRLSERGSHTSPGSAAIRLGQACAGETVPSF